MYEEGVKQYFTAKRLASKRIFGRVGRRMRFRPADLPSNGEIRDALLQPRGAGRGRRADATSLSRCGWWRVMRARSRASSRG